MKTARCCAAAVALLASGIGLADETLGEIKGKGARLISKDEGLVLFAGATVTGLTDSAIATNFHLKNAPDGTLSGQAEQAPQSDVEAPKGYGTWKIADDGKYCIEAKWTHRVPDSRWCAAVYRLGDVHFLAWRASDTAKAMKIAIKR
jgi:hypothetical protein